jgi:flavin-dependent dehydrogenase
MATAVKEPKQWFEQDSAWYYKRRVFKEFIETVSNQSATIETVLEGWRELPILSKDFMKKTVKEVVENQLISQLYEELRDDKKNEASKEV